MPVLTSPAAVVGAGFSGSLIAAHLAARGVEVTIFEGSNRAGRGLAYSATLCAHRLNVRAGAMSAFPQEPDQFANYWAARGGDPHEFASRSVYGDYLGSILGDALATGRVRLVQANVRSAEQSDEGWVLQADDGTRVHAQHAVLATGNEPSKPPAWAAACASQVVSDPWGGEAEAAIAKAAATNADVLMIGTGLTMIDMVLALDEAGHGGIVWALSRRGLMPRPHAAFEAAPVSREKIPTGSLARLWRWTRERSERVGWRAAVDSLRPHSQALWQEMPLADQSRFLRHARPFWDVHRHRIPPQISDRLEQLKEEGRLRIISGRIRTAFQQEERCRIEIQLRRPAGKRLLLPRIGSVFNCTGPLPRLVETQSPLLRQLLRDGYIRPDMLGLGAEVDRNGRVSTARGLWCLGALTRGKLWEITAVPDIRNQALAVAEMIAGEIGNRNSLSPEIR